MKTQIFTILFFLTMFTAQSASARVKFNQQKELQVLEHLNVYPNPINQKGTIDIILEKESKVNIEFYDLSGQKVKAMQEIFLNEGSNKIEFKASELHEGYYFCKVTTDQWVKTKRILVRR